MDASVEWYSEKLDMIILDQTSIPSRGLKQANLVKEGLHLELIELPGSIEPAAWTFQQGFFKIGFTVDEFDRWIENLRASDTEFKGEVVIDPIRGTRTVIILDPDGNRIQLFEK